MPVRRVSEAADLYYNSTRPSAPSRHALSRASCFTGKRHCDLAHLHPKAFPNKQSDP